MLRAITWVICAIIYLVLMKDFGLFFCMSNWIIISIKEVIMWPSLAASVTAPLIFEICVSIDQKLEWCHSLCLCRIQIQGRSSSWNPEIRAASPSLTLFHPTFRDSYRHSSHLLSRPSLPSCLATRAPRTSAGGYMREKTLRHKCLLSSRSEDPCSK